MPKLPLKTRLKAKQVKKVASPTGKPSKVRQEIKDFDAGKKVAGKRPAAATPAKVGGKKAVFKKFPIKSKSLKAAEKL